MKRAPDRGALARGGRVLWWLLLAALALACVGLQLDRASRRDAALAAHVPEPFRFFAQAHALDAALLARSPASLAESDRLLARRPLPAEHLSGRALALAQQGREDEARAALTLAAGRGWREPLTQAFVMQLAGEAGRQDVVATRALALWRLDQNRASLAAPLGIALASDDGRGALADWLAQGPNDAALFAYWAANELPPAAVASLIVAADARGAAFSCRDKGGLGATLLRRGAPREAERVFGDDCAAIGSEARGLLRRSDDGPGALYGWQAEPGARFVEGSGERATLAYELDKPGYHGIARRLAALGPGLHPVSLDAETDEALALRLIVVCLATGGEERGRATVRLEAGARIAIPESGCAAQDIVLQAPRGGGLIRSLRLTQDPEA